MFLPCFLVKVASCDAEVATYRVLRLQNLPQILLFRKLGRRGLDRMIRYHVANAEMGAERKISGRLIS